MHACGTKYRVFRAQIRSAGMDFWPSVRQDVVMRHFFKYFIDEVILPFVQDIQAIIQSSTGKVSYILIIVLNKPLVSLIIY
jgi:hypothetical protein